MHFMESCEKLGPQARLGAVCCSVLPEGLGPEAVKSCYLSLLLPKAGWRHNHPQVLWTCEREEEEKDGHEKQERRKQP